MPPIALFLVIGIGIAVVVRVAAGGLDGDRIRRYIGERGGQISSITWEPFGPGWFGGQHARIYRIEYRDADGREHSAYAKTSALAGVYLSEVSAPDGNDPSREESRELERLREENRRLRDDLRARIRDIPR